MKKQQLRLYEQRRQEAAARHKVKRAKARRRGGRGPGQAKITQEQQAAIRREWSVRRWALGLLGRGE